MFFVGSNFQKYGTNNTEEGVLYYIRNNCNEMTLIRTVKNNKYLSMLTHKNKKKSYNASPEVLIFLDFYTFCLVHNIIYKTSTDFFKFSIEMILSRMN